MKKILIYCCLLSALVLPSCADWLDVRPQEEMAAEDLFSTQKGFQDALIGCYQLLRDADIYGETLTMSVPDLLAQILYYGGAQTSKYTEFQNFEYESDNAKSQIATTYDKMYNVIAQTNMIITRLESKRDVFTDRNIYAMVAGEAYAIRALCHFDVLRLFGQLPQNATKEVKLPYAMKVDRNELPDYYTFDEFAALIEKDLNSAIETLEGDDPLFTYTFTELNTIAGKNIFWCYRQQRFNYWAVKALQARFYLYLGDASSKTKSLQIVREIIEAKGVDGKALMTLGGMNPDAADPASSVDIARGYLASPSECLLMLNRRNFSSSVVGLFGSGSTNVGAGAYLLFWGNTSSEPNKIVELFAEQGNPPSEGGATPTAGTVNNRYNLWSRGVPGSYSTYWNILNKYYYLEENAEMTKNEVVPILRLSEMYLIAMELTNDLDEGNRLYKEYMKSHGVYHSSVISYFTSLESLREWVYTEHIRELIGEGQTFYMYKRRGATQMRYRNDPVTEENYILPLPDSEFDINEYLQNN